jgi:hypothetical protein
MGNRQRGRADVMLPEPLAHGLPDGLLSGLAEYDPKRRGMGALAVLSNLGRDARTDEALIRLLEKAAADESTALGAATVISSAYHSGHRTPVALWAHRIAGEGLAKGSPVLKAALSAEFESEEGFDAKFVRDIGRLSKDFAAGCGLDERELLDAWSASGKFEHNPLLINFANGHRLQTQRPGAPKMLRDTFGLRAFGRYHVETLVRQADEMDAKGPYGLAVYPWSDKEGYFLQQSDALAAMHRGGRMLRVAEAKNRSEFLGRLEGIRTRFGAASYGIIGGHGGKDSIWLSPAEGPKEGVIRADDLEGSEFRRALGLFPKGAPIILNSCGTGAKGGIAQRLSALGYEVLAPEKPARIADIRAEDIRGATRLEASFDSEGAPVRTMRYVDGMLVG